MKHILVVTAAAIALAGCQKVEAPPPQPMMLSDSDAEIMANRNNVEFASTDPKRIEALYAPNVVAFDPGVPQMITDRVTFDKAQEAFAALKLDSFQSKDRKVQILDADTFIVSGVMEMGSTKIPSNRETVRYTQVYEKQPDSRWLIVNEHISPAPKGT